LTVEGVAVDPEKVTAVANSKRQPLSQKYGASLDWLVTIEDLLKGSLRLLSR
jgi:hypothetical protein